MKFVTSLAFAPSDQILPLSKVADEAGFAAVALSDHVVHPEKIDTPYPYTPDGAPRWEPFTEWPDPWVTAGAIGAVTERLEVVTSIFVLPMRNPFLVAKAIGTAAVLSQGRVTLGIGVGWMREEFDLCEQPFSKRGKRCDEMIEVMRKLWQGGGMVGHEGEFYRFAPLEMSPTPPGGEVPIFAGGLSDAALRRAATRCDGWISDLHTTEELKGYIAKLSELRADSERADRPFSVIVSCLDAVDADGYRRLEDIGVTHVNTQPWVFHGAPTELQGRVDAMRRFADDFIAR